MYWSILWNVIIGSNLWDVITYHSCSLYLLLHPNCDITQLSYMLLTYQESATYIRTRTLSSLYLRMPMNGARYASFYTETEDSSGWLPMSSLETLKGCFNAPCDDHGSHTDDLSVSVAIRFSGYQWFWLHVIVFMNQSKWPPKSREISLHSAC